MATYQMGIDPYDSESTDSSAGIAIIKDGKILTPISNRSSLLREFVFKAKLMYFLYFKRVPLFCETTKKIVRPKRLMIFRLKSRNLGKRK
jgi:hypothetical protein